MAKKRHITIGSFVFLHHWLCFSGWRNPEGWAEAALY